MASLGNEGWSYDDVLPYFVKAEGNKTLSDRYHGTDGPLRVASHSPSNPLVERYLAAAKEVGIPFNPDFNGAVSGRLRSFAGHAREPRPLERCGRISSPSALAPEPDRPDPRSCDETDFDWSPRSGVEYLRFGA